ncbi:MAG: nuclear transport factor 2 family protein [Pseudomonadota bacterium]
MKRALILAIALSTSVISAASEDTPQQLENEIMTTVNRFLQAINTADIALMAEVVRPDAMTYARIQEADGSFSTKARLQAHFLEDLKKNPQFTERIWDPVILANEQIAAVWAQYDFYVDGEFSHCGTDLFNLLYDEGKWKIANSSWTVVKEDCPASPLGKFAQ